MGKRIQLQDVSTTGQSGRQSAVDKQQAAGLAITFY